MKKFYAFLILLFLCSRIFAQEEVRKGYIGITTGPSIPIGNFASNDNFYDGYAKTGLNINLLTFGYKIWNNFGITGSWFGSANPIDYYGTDGMWGIGSIMVGPLYSVPLAKKTNWDFKGMFGYILETKSMDFYETVNATGPGYELGTSLRYDILKRWCIIFNLEYFQTKLDIQPDQDPKVSLINTSIGIAYRLK